MNFTPEEIQAWKEMAELTWSKCMSTCKILGSCCSPEYCAMAYDYAKEHGIDLEPIPEARLPFLGPQGCVVAPHLRPLCTLHQCKINGMGFDPKDPDWTDKYFALREKLETLGDDQPL